MGGEVAPRETQEVGVAPRRRVGSIEVRRRGEGTKGRVV